MAGTPPLDDDDVQNWSDRWEIPDGLTYLNHGSFGIGPTEVRRAHHRWLDRIQANPMQFFLRELEQQLDDATSTVAALVGAPPDDLVLVENATYAMNIVAASVRLAPGDEVLLTDHEYGAVLRLWERRCREAGATVRQASLPLPIATSEEVVDAICSAVNDRTRLVVVSHVTSATAIVLPVEEICKAMRTRGVAVCIDGPHAVAMRPVDLAALDCDYYTASCHKWLSAPIGSGFLYVHPRAQRNIEPPVTSWGRLLPERPVRWRDEFIWLGTRDPSSLLTAADAVRFLQTVGLETFRRHTHALARYARCRITEWTAQAALVPDAIEWVGSMIALPLPPGEGAPLQAALRDRYRIEVPIVNWHDRRMVRVSCHLYTRPSDVDRLLTALVELLS
jgi:isopenicillin-N epimerase